VALCPLGEGINLVDNFFKSIVTALKNGSIVIIVTIVGLSGPNHMGRIVPTGFSVMDKN
jgi:hypothetical protein